MNFANVLLVFRKELTETLRDRRTLLIMLVVPIFLYPLLLILVQQLAIFGRRQLEEAPVTVVAQGAGGELLALLQSDSSISVEFAAAGTISSVQQGEADLLLVVQQPSDEHASGRAALYYDATRERSRIALETTTEHLEAWSDSLLMRRLAAASLPESFAEPLVLADSSVATAERMGGYALGRFLPMLLILMTLLGAFYPAIDLSAGEKERGTLETLLTTPVPPREVVAGKFLTVALVGISAAVLNLFSMLLTFRYAAVQFAEAADMQVSLPWSTVLTVVLFLIPLAVFFSAVFLGMALRAQSFKEAQNTLTPVQLASILPMTLPMVPGIPLTYPLALVPIGGVALLFRELMTGGAPPGPAVAALVATIFYALLALRFASRSFGREDVLFGVREAPVGRRSLGQRIAGWRSGRRILPTPAESLGFVAAVGLLYFYVGVTLQIRMGEEGILVSQLLLLALPAVLFAVLGPYRTRQTLALRTPSPRALAAGILIILGGMPIGWLLAWAQSLFMEIPAEFLTALEDLIRAETASEILWLLIVVALTPAICEELVFRGVLLQGLTSGMKAGRAIILSALVFGAFHLSIETAIRFLPSAWLGALLGLVVWRTGSLFVSGTMHFINNGLIVLIVATPGLEQLVMGPNEQPRWSLVALGAVLLGVGLRILPKRGGSLVAGEVLASER